MFEQVTTNFCAGKCNLTSEEYNRQSFLVLTNPFAYYFGIVGFTLVSLGVPKDVVDIKNYWIYFRRRSQFRNPKRASSGRRMRPPRLSNAGWHLSCAFRPQAPTLQTWWALPLTSSTRSLPLASRFTFSGGWFSAVSTPMFAIKHSFVSVFRDLQY